MKLIWDLTYVLGVLAGMTFLIGYGIKARGRWYHYRTGWHLMAMVLSITTMLGGLLWESAVGNISERIWYAIIVSVVAVMWHQTYLLIDMNRANPDLRRQSPQSSTPTPRRR